ncbi:hypothetical protein RR46_06289 [Papilio xuthus]|uniref:Uncharacterized protein n=1 Tax=Papilio xuthus TaxID=66420 RepID=A0A194QI53_PAPXU|nr:hypothetical protein RR46_06289 [Papilio xuthus]
MFESSNFKKRHLKIGTPTPPAVRQQRPISDVALPPATTASNSARRLRPVTPDNVCGGRRQEVQDKTKAASGPNKCQPIYKSVVAYGVKLITENNSSNCSHRLTLDIISSKMKLSTVNYIKVELSSAPGTARAAPPALLIAQNFDQLS